MTAKRKRQKKFNWFSTLASKAGWAVGVEWKDRLRWLLKFIQQRPELHTLQGEELETAIREVAFFSLGLTSPGNLRERPALDLQDFANVVHGGLVSLFGTGHQRWEVRLQPNIDSHLMFYVVRTADGIAHGFNGRDVMEAARLNAHALIAEHLSEISRCSREKCQRFFLPQGRQEFCTKHCSQLERTDRWRDNNRVEVNKQRRAAYFKKSKKRLPRIDNTSP
jgi:hypothetical protein